MGKLILKVHGSALITSNIVRVSDASVEKIRSVQRASGLPATTIVNQMIDFALERLEIKNI